MANEQLRTAIHKSGLSVQQLSELTQVDPKTIERWVYMDRRPHRANRRRVAQALNVDETVLWPHAPAEDPEELRQEVLRVFPNRSSVPTQTWIDLIQGAEESIDLIAYAGSFLHDALPGFVPMIQSRARAGTRIRLIFGDPACRAVQIRGEEEGIGQSLADRCRLTWKYLDALAGLPCVEMRQHSTTLYASIFRFDSQTLVNHHLLGNAASQSPVIQLCDKGAGYFQAIADSFERTWELAEDRTP